MSTNFIGQYNQLSLLYSCMIDLPHPNPATTEIWNLDQKIRAEFSGPIQMWEQGLISSVELFNNLQLILLIERKNQ